MSGQNVLRDLKEGVLVYWNARTAQEQKFLLAGGVVVALALVYSLFIGPAVEGRAALEKSLPKLRQDAAVMQGLAAEASELARAGKPRVVPMTRETLTASLATRSIVPQSVAITGEFARLAFKDVSFANLVMWLDEQRRTSLVRVNELDLAAQGEAGKVSGSITLSQGSGE